jgi:hypothetical protein
MWKERFPVKFEEIPMSAIIFQTSSSPEFHIAVRLIDPPFQSSSFAQDSIRWKKRVLTASSAERVRLVVTLTKAGGTLRCIVVSFCVFADFRPRNWESQSFEARF